MSEITWTEDELNEFLKLINMVSSQDQMDRINGRFDMTTFIAKHSKAKCDAMFAYIEKERLCGKCLYFTEGVGCGYTSIPDKQITAGSKGCKEWAK